MILIDTSAWIEFLRDTGSATCNRVEALLEGEIAICDVVRMEVLAGARDERHLRSLQQLLARAVMLSTIPADYESAAALYRQCRRQGNTVRKLLDCLISAVAIRTGAPILHNDVDFDVLGRYTELRTDPHNQNTATEPAG